MIMRSARIVFAPALLLFCTVFLAATGSGLPCLVQGRIEILNPKARTQGKGADAGGVVLWLTATGSAPKPENSHLPKRRLEQRDKRFVPHIMAIQTGTEVDFPNRDPFFHNVFSVYEGKIFDLGLYATGESRPVLFSRPGVSYIFCNIHPQMSAVIVTVNTPYFAVSSTDGTFAIKNVPEGTYEFKLWHERSDAQQLAALSRTVSIRSGASDLGTIRLDEAGYIPQAHKNKYGEEYDHKTNMPDYRR
jgi:plastocyanin